MSLAYSALHAPLGRSRSALGALARSCRPWIALHALVFCCAPLGLAQQTELARIFPSDPATGDNFGRTVAIAGDVAIVGAYFDDHGAGTDAGSVYAFERSGANWTEQQKLLASDGAAGDRFGWIVAISGDTAIVGVRQDDHAGGIDAGSAYVFVRSGSTWNLQQKLVASDARAGQFFGNVTIDGDRVVVGAPMSRLLGLTNAGAAYLCLRSGSAWAD